MNIDVLREDHTVRLYPGGEIESPVELKPILEEGVSPKVRHVILDLLDKEFLTSSKIGSVMWIFKELEQKNGRLSLLVNSPFLLKTLQVTGIDQFLAIFNSQEQALEKIEV